MKVSQVGVLGMGTMGQQIGIVLAQGGFPTLLCDQTEAQVEKGISQIKIFLASRVKKGKLDENKMNEIVSRIQGTTNIQDFSKVDFGGFVFVCVI